MALLATHTKKMEKMGARIGYLFDPKCPSICAGTLLMQGMPVLVYYIDRDSKMYSKNGIMAFSIQGEAVLTDIVKERIGGIVFLHDLARIYIEEYERISAIKDDMLRDTAEEWKAINSYNPPKLSRRSFSA